MRIVALLGSAFIISLLAIERSCAAVTPLFLTGDSAADISGAVFDSLQPGAINGNGAIVFPATLQLGLGGVTTVNNQGVWQFDSVPTLVARTGTGNVPEVAGAAFGLFRDFGINHSGDVYVRGSLSIGAGGVTTSNEEGLWKFTSSGDEIVVRKGSSIAPGVPTTTYSELPNALILSGNGQIGLKAKLNFTTGVNSSNSRGVWSYDSAGGSFIAREQVTVTPGLVSIFEAFAEALVVNDNQQLAFRAEIDSFVGDPTSIGIWRYTDAVGELIIREGIGGVPGVSVTSFLGMSDPAFNGLGQIAISSSLTHQGTVDSTNDAGVWLYTGTTGALIAQSGSGGVAGVAGANFQSFQKPLLSDSGLLMVEAELQIGVAGVTSSNDRGLWTFDGANSSLVARRGSGGVPGVLGASFADFNKMALNSVGDVAVHASLQTGGGINASNDAGIWLFDSSEGTGTLVAREGDLLAGRVIESLDFLGDTGGNDGGSTGFNDQGKLLFQADFTNGDSGLFLFQSLGADFDGDGDVDSADLTHPTLGWEARYGIDLDGADFLLWQRQMLGAGSLTAAVATVPEPGTLSLCGSLAAILGCYRSRSLGNKLSI